ncbi:MAG: ATP-grasp domain-containing protein [Thermoleophilaceae bacterium]
MLRGRGRRAPAATPAARAARLPWRALVSPARVAALNILVTSLSRKVPLLAALREALDRSPASGCVWGADSDPGCVGRYFAERFWEMPPLSEPGGPDALAGFCARERIGLVIPTRDGELALLASLRERLEGEGVHVAVSAAEAIGTCLDKLRFHGHCRRHGLATAATATAPGELDAERLVVKERHGAGTRGLAVGLDREAARAHAEHLREPIFQPVLGGAEHSVDLYVNRRGEVVEAAPRARIRVHDGESTVTETVEHPQLVAAAVGLAESLDLRGHAVVQAFVEGPEVTLLECNPRVGGGSTLGFHAGVETPAWAIAEALGETVAPRPGSYRRGLRLVRYPADRLIER